MKRYNWLPPLLARLFVGLFFVETGWGKIHNLERMSQQFAEWKIPFPPFSAAVSGYTEFLGGAFIVLGLLTRLVSIPLLFNMVVALVTVKLKKVSGWVDFVELDEPLYALVFLWLLISGPGWVSLDCLWSTVRTRSRRGTARR